MTRVDPTLLSLAEEFVSKGSCVWDVGANVGLFSIAAAQLAGHEGRVLSLEPDAWLVQLLRRSATLQAPTLAPLTVVPAAVASTMAVREFCIAQRSRSANFLAGYGTSQAGGTREKEMVIAVTLDWLLESFPPPNVIKVDVEGAEAEVFQGATRLFEAVRPVVLCEVGNAAQSAVSAFFTTRGYRILDGAMPSAERTPLDRAPWCTIAMPT